MDKYTKRNTDGSVNITASVVAYTQALTEWVATNEVDPKRVEQAVETVFDRHNGRLPVPLLLDQVVAEISSDPSQFNTLRKSVRNYVNGQKVAGRIKVVAGQHGGAVRVSTATVFTFAHSKGL